MRRRLAILLTPLLLLAMLPASVAASPAAAARAEHDRIVAFWTPARMASAQPRDITFDAVRGFRVTGERMVPRAATDPVRTLSSGGSYGGGGNIATAEGKVFFVMGAFLYKCSATPVVDSRTGYALVLTAGHCAFDKGKFATNWVFIPNYDAQPSDYNNCAGTISGCWTAKALFVHKNFASQKRFNNTAVTHDWAFALLNPGGFSNQQLQLDAVTGGAYGISFTSPGFGTELAAYGYPAAAPYSGTDLSFCQGRIGTDPGTSNMTWSMACNMTGGSSGGGWLDGDWKNFPAFPSGGTTGTGGARLRSLNSYGYSGVPNMYGPMFNTRTQVTYNAANGTATTNTIVSGG